MTLFKGTRRCPTIDSGCATSLRTDVDLRPSHFESRWQTMEPFHLDTRFIGWQTYQFTFNNSLYFYPYQMQPKLTISNRKSQVTQSGLISIQLIRLGVVTNSWSGPLASSQRQHQFYVIRRICNVMDHSAPSDPKPSAVKLRKNS